MISKGGSHNNTVDYKFIAIGFICLMFYTSILAFANIDTDWLSLNNTNNSQMVIMIIGPDLKMQYKFDHVAARTSCFSKN